MSGRDDSSVENAMHGIATPVESRKGAGMGSKDGVEGQMGELFKLNQVLYRLPPSLSLVSKRTIIKQQFQQMSYPNCTNTTLQCIFNTGEYYIAPRTSFLVIRVGYQNSPIIPAVTSPATDAKDRQVYAHIGQGNVTSLFEEVTLISASGTEIDRQQNKGLLNTHLLRNTMPLPYIESAGTVQGFSEKSVFDTFDGLGMTLPSATATVQNVQGAVPVNTSHELNATGPKTFVIPITQLLGAFNPYMANLIPAGALAGANFLLRMKQPQESLIWSGPGWVSYDGTNWVTNTFNLNTIDVTDIYFMLDAFQMNDSVLKRLNEVSAGQDGLSLLFDTFDNSSISNAAIGAVEVQVQQARSRVARSFCVVRDLDVVSNPWANSLASEAVVPTANNSNYGVMDYKSADTKPTANTANYTNPALTSLGSTGGVAYFKIIPPVNSRRVWQGAGVQPKVNSYQVQLGSLFFPQQPLGHDVKEFIMNHNYVWGRGMSDEHEYTSSDSLEVFGADGRMYTTANPPVRRNPALYNSVANLVNLPETWTSTANWQINYGTCTFGVTAERSQLLQLSGLPISNARLLRHKFVFNSLPPSGSTRQIDCFTQYTRVMKVFLGGKIVLRE